MGRLRDLLEKIDDTTTAEVEVPEWPDPATGNPVVVKVRSMTAKARAQMVASARDPKTGEMDFERFYPAIIIATAIDPENDEPLFAKGDEELISGLNASAVERVASAGMQVSGMDTRADVSVDTAGGSVEDG